MEDNTASNKPTSRVIDSLHSQIDDLKTELETVKISHDDYKKKYVLVSQKNDSFVDQLANAKHENDMINALLKRKERRIADLEDQYNELSSSNESLQLNNKNMKIRCENLQQSSASSTAEYERLKIAYDALIASQVEYKRHYQKELNTLASKLEAYKTENKQRFQDLSSKLSSNDKDIDTLLDSMTNKRKALDNLYVNKNKTILELLTSLAKAAKIHGLDTKSTLEENTVAILSLLEKYPDLQEKILTHEKVEVDLDELISESNETLSNCSFESEATLVNSPELSDSASQSKNADHLKQDVKASSLSRSNTLQAKKRKNKRNSVRIDSKSGPDFSSITTPTTGQFALPKKPTFTSNNDNRGFSSRSPLDSSRNITPPHQDYEINPKFQNQNVHLKYNYGHSRQHSNTNNRSLRNISNNSTGSNDTNNKGGNYNNNNNNRSKRKSLYGGQYNSKRNSQIIDPNALNISMTT